MFENYNILHTFVTINASKLYVINFFTIFISLSKNIHENRMKICIFNLNTSTYTKSAYKKLKKNNIKK